MVFRATIIFSVVTLTSCLNSVKAFNFGKQQRNTRLQRTLVSSGSFTKNQLTTFDYINKGRCRHSPSELKMIEPITSTIMDTFPSATSTYIATIDADIANIADDQFGLVFAGGIAVMFGGVFSALIVGAILNAGQSYGRVIADSYVDQDGNNDPFASMSDEEREKAEELLEKLRASKSGQKIPETLTLKRKENVGEKEPKIETESKAKGEAVSIFSDYDD